MYVLSEALPSPVLWSNNRVHCVPSLTRKPSMKRKVTESSLMPSIRSFYVLLRIQMWAYRAFAQTLVLRTENAQHHPDSLSVFKAGRWTCWKHAIILNACSGELRKWLAPKSQSNFWCFHYFSLLWVVVSTSQTQLFKLAGEPGVFLNSVHWGPGAFSIKAFIFSVDFRICGPNRASSEVASDSGFGIHLSTSPWLLCQYW